MPRLILECAVRAALIALGTAAALRLLRVKTAGARHAAWAAVVVLMLLLPAWTAWGPRASVHVLPAADLAMLPSPPAASDAAVFVLSQAPAPVPAPRVRNWRFSLVGLYLLGALALLSRLTLGTLRAHTLVRQAVNRDGRLTSSLCAAPVTVGMLRPAVILPESWRRWPPAQLEAVLTHEREHVRRRDPLVQWLALLNRALFWFHPLAWWLERRLSVLAEEACDAAVLARGHDPYDYSEYLLEIARTVTRTGVRVNLAGMAMPGSGLPQRIRQILGRHPAPRLTRARAVCLALSCAAVSAVFAAAAVDRQARIPLPPLPPVPPAAVLPAAVASPGPVAPAPAVPAPGAPASPAPPASPASAPPAPPPPQPPQPPQDHRLLALYFDMAGRSPDAQTGTIAAATQFVRSQMQPADLVTILSWDGVRVKVWQDFTWDRDLLVSSMQHLSGDSTEAPDAGKQLDGLRSATEMLGALPGKKSLIYFSTGAPRTAAQNQLQAAVDAAVRANVAFYPIDASGLSAPAPYVLCREDTVSVSVQGDPRFDGAYIIRPDGMISIPLVGEIKAAGLTPLELQHAINQALLPRLKTPRTFVNVLKVHLPGK